MGKWMSTEMANKIIELSKSCKSKKEISRITGVGYDAIKKRLKGITLHINPINTHEDYINKLKTMPNGCIEWQGSLTGKGYGQISINGKAWLAHRYSYTLNNGDCTGVFVCHKCDNPKCVNPEHLFAGTRKDNMEDMAKKLRVSSRKLDPSDVSEIRRLVDSKVPRANISNQFKINKNTIHKIVNKKIWKWLE